jgi:hypothetical protein
MAGDDDVKDRDVAFHRMWLGLAQPIEGLVFSVPVLADAQIAPDIPTELSARFASQLEPNDPPRIRNLERFFREFLGYARTGMLVPRGELPSDLSFYAQEGGQEIRPTFALARGPFETSDDPFAAFEEKPKATTPSSGDTPSTRYFALAWDVTEYGEGIDLDAAETQSGPWRYPPTAKFERLLRRAGIPIGFLFNGRELRLVYAPAGETTAHLTFRVEHLKRPDGRPLLAALDLLLHARRAYTASAEHTLEGLLAESRRRQADVTDELAKQVFEAVEILVAGFEFAAARDISPATDDWLRAALEEGNDHFYQGVLSIVLRLVFLLYAEDTSLLPVDHPTYAEHLSIGGLYERLADDVGAHPESMHHRFGAYGQLLSLFRSVFFGVRHGSLELPPRRGRLFDPNAFPFLEGGLPDWTAAVVDPEARAAAHPPSIDDGVIYDVLHRLVVFEGQRLSYRTLDVEQIGSVYESLMGYHVLRIASPAVRAGKHGVWIESDAIRVMSPTDRARYLKETCGLNVGPITALDKALKEAKTESAVAEALVATIGRKGDAHRHRASLGRLVLQPGEERRRTASHYTPRSLTEKVVKRTLEPLLACLGAERTPEQILQLKICDPAMGSGAFLVATCRELASEIVAAWTRQGELAKILEAHGDAHLHARRLVAQKCLYGVDKNAAAVELAKLSLWLVTLSKTLPFTFVDHALRHGDSLVGLDFKQIESFHWAPAEQTETVKVLLRETLDEAVGLRQQILALADHDASSSQMEKRRLLEFSQQAIERVRTIADACVGAFFAETKDAAREKERKRRLDLVRRWLGGDAEAGAATESLARDARTKLAPFHWWIEFPEVFFEERPDPLQGGAVNGAALMEGVVGNPPFLGSRQIAEAYGKSMSDWLAAQTEGAHGNADYVAYFFRRAATLIGRVGIVGLVATKAVLETETRNTGLRYLLSHGWKIHSATTPRDWPGSAAVKFVEIVMGTGVVDSGTRLDEAAVEFVNSRLEAKGERADPALLRGNEGVMFLGNKIMGQGFLLEPPVREELVARGTPKRLVPMYLTGDDLTTHPLAESSRYVINLGRMTLEQAELYPDLLAVVRAEVKPERDGGGSHPLAMHGKKFWWQFGSRVDALYEALSKQKRCIGISRITKYFSFTFLPTDRVFNEKIFVFTSEAATLFALLQSRLHERWARQTAVLHGGTLTYPGSECFETFPFPKSDPRNIFESLEGIGEKLYEKRAEYMRSCDVGLTKTYNAMKDPACDDARILELRRLSEEMDRAVLDAYGWRDIVVPRYCPMDDADRRALAAFEDEVIDRLYLLNAERAAEEERLGLNDKKGAKKTAASKVASSSATKTSAKKRGGPPSQGGLF